MMNRWISLNRNQRNDEDSEKSKTRRSHLSFKMNRKNSKNSISKCPSSSSIPTIINEKVGNESNTVRTTNTKQLLKTNSCEVFPRMTPIDSPPKTTKYDQESKNNHRTITSTGYANRVLSLDNARQFSTNKSIDVKQLAFVKRIGRGGNATIYRGKLKSSTENDDTTKSLDVAIKVIALTETGEESWKMEMNMLKLLPCTAHPNIVNLYGFSSLETKKNPPTNPTMNQSNSPLQIATKCVVLEYCNGGDLSDALLKPTPNNFFQHVAQSIAEGISFLHQHQIIHRDVKPDNILLHGDPQNTNRFVVKLTDFGLAKKLEQEDKDEHTAETGTYRYMAPEVTRHDPYSFSVDVYSFAIVLWQLLTRETPFSTNVSQVEAAGRVALYHDRPPLPCETPSKVKNIIKRSWHKDPEQRPTVMKTLDSLKLLSTTLTKEEKLWIDHPCGHPVYNKGGDMRRSTWF